MKNFINIRGNSIVIFLILFFNVYTYSNIDSIHIKSESDFFSLNNLLDKSNSDSIIILIEKLNFLIEKNYNITINEKIKFLSFNGGKSLFSSNINEKNTIGSVFGILEFICHKDLELILNNFNILYKSTDYGNQCGVYIDAKGCVVKIDNLNIDGVTYLGIFTERASGGYIKNSITNNNKFGGIGLRSCSNMFVENCEFSYNGSQVPNWGYGFALVNCYPLNQNIVVRNNKAFNNQRKGLDVHSGINILFENNYVKGFEYAGIYAVSDRGGDRRVANIKIINNFIDGDTAHFKVRGIDIGSYGNNPDSSGYFIVENNRIINTDDIKNSCAIYISNPDSGVAIDKIIIKKNIIENGSADKNSPAIYCKKKNIIAENIIIEANEVHSKYSKKYIQIDSAKNLQIIDNTLLIEKRSIFKKYIKFKKYNHVIEGNNIVKLIK